MNESVKMRDPEQVAQHMGKIETWLEDHARQVAHDVRYDQAVDSYIVDLQTEIYGEEHGCGFYLGAPAMNIFSDLDGLIESQYVGAIRKMADGIFLRKPDDARS